MASDEELMEFMEQHEQNEKTYTNFAEAFSGLKKTKFYEEAKILPGPSTRVPGMMPAPTKAVNVGGPVLVNPRQRGNHLLSHLRRVAWRFEESITADYVCTATTGILYLSLRYYALNPDYIHSRLKNLTGPFELRVLLVEVDSKDPHQALKSLTRICLLAEMTLMLAWSSEEAARIVETYKIYENKPPDSIMEKVEDDPYTRVVGAIASVRSVNRTDATTLLSTFGPLGKLTGVRLQDLELCPGLGPLKASKLHSCLHQPFLRENNPPKGK